MIAPGEKLIADISVKDSVSRQEFTAFMMSLKKIYRDDTPWVYMFFDNTEVENEKLDILRLIADMFYPTIYHEDVEITSASVINRYYEDSSLNTSMLTIKISYLGEDSKLRNWYREYIYTKQPDGSWLFSHFDGQTNFLGDGFKKDYLKLKA